MIQIRVGVCSIFAAFGAAVAMAQTNLDYWAQDLKIGLNGWTAASSTSSGIISTVRPGAVRVFSGDIIQALANMPVLAISKGITNFTTVTTNRVNRTNVYITNEVVMAYPAFTTVINPSYSPSAKLLMLEPLGTNSFNVESLVVIRDGSPPVDYDIRNYLLFSKVSFDNRPDPVIVGGKFDTAHGLRSATEYSIDQVVFDSSGFTGAPPGMVFDVQGRETRRSFSLVEKGRVIDLDVTRSATAVVAGTGQIRGTNGFAVLQGQITVSGGKHETR